MEEYGIYFIYIFINNYICKNIDKNKQLLNEIHSVMYLIPDLNTQDKVLKILYKICNYNKSEVVGN